ncbi:MAG: PA14 domain-containing protein [Akkermansiaceae bacterium]
MTSKLSIFLLSVGLSGTVLSNPNGEAVFKQLCSACHGLDGKGAGEGAFPPLDGSEWVKGSPDRIAQILLHGLTGPIEVKGKTYDLVMPPQGNLTDQQSVDVINYVVGKWGDKKGGYTLAAYEKAGKKSSDRTEAWTADELLKLYPLADKPKEQSHLENLLMHSYKGTWKLIPDFSELEAGATEEEHDGFLSLEKINQKHFFGLVWEGELRIEKSGQYEFEIDGDDAVRLVIDGKKLAEVTGLGPMNGSRKKKGVVALEAGLHDFRFEYLQNRSNKGILARFKDVKSKKWMWLTKKVAQKRKAQKIPVIDLTPKDGRVRVYNNFIVGSSARGLAVGFPVGNHYSYSPDRGTVDQLWRGKFISGGRHWTQRGKGFEAPLGKLVSGVSDNKASWKLDGKDAEISYLGYKLDADGNPMFRYTVNGVEVQDEMTASEAGFTRSVSFLGKPSESTQLVLCEKFSGKVSGLSAEVNPNFTISVSDKNGALKAQGKQLILSNISSTLTIEYQWKK